MTVQDVPFLVPFLVFATLMVAYFILNVTNAILASEPPEQDSEPVARWPATIRLPGGVTVKSKDFIVTSMEPKGVGIHGTFTTGPPHYD